MQGRYDVLVETARYKREPADNPPQSDSTDRFNRVGTQPAQCVST
jgi:hypothetical protein